MDIALILNKLVPQANHNPACFDFTEKEARKKKLWRDDRPMPSISDLEKEWIIIKSELDANKYIEIRSKAHIPIPKQLDMIYWDRKNNTRIWDDYVDKIKSDIPKP